MTISKLTAAAILAAATAILPARAEVSAETDVTGAYLRTVVFANASVKNLRIWSVNRAKPDFTPLNAAGDTTGDLWPFVAESPVGDRWPWVVWSHFNGTDFDLVYSRWVGVGWSTISNVESPGDADDALDPAVAFDLAGRPHLVWLSVGEGPKAVFLSIFLSTRWMTPFRVSDAGEDATDPSVDVQPDGTIVIAYDTPNGQVTKTIRFTTPRTITDDITPFGSLTVTSSTNTPTAP